MAQSCRHFEEYTTLGIIPHVRVLGSFPENGQTTTLRATKNTIRKERKKYVDHVSIFFAFRKNSSSEPLPSSYSRNSLSRTKHAQNTHAHTHSRTPQQALPPPDVSLARVLTFHDDKLIIHFVGPSRTTVAVPPLAERAATPPVLIMEIWISLPTIFSVDASGLRYLR